MPRASFLPSPSVHFRSGESALLQSLRRHPHPGQESVSEVEEGQRDGLGHVDLDSGLVKAALLDSEYHKIIAFLISADQPIAVGRQGKGTRVVAIAANIVQQPEKAGIWISRKSGQIVAPRTSIGYIDEPPVGMDPNFRREIGAPETLGQARRRLPEFDGTRIRKIGIS